MKYYNVLLLLIFSLGCVQDDEFSIPDLVCDDPNLPETKTVKEIKSASGSNPKKYENEDVIIGYVVSSDEGGNIYKNISFQDLNGNGFNISLDKYDNYTAFEPGRKVYIKLQNLYTQIDFGALEIGELYNDTQIGRIPEVLIRDYLVRSCEVIDEENLINKISLADISDKYLHTLVEFENVQFKDTEVGENYYSENNDLGGATNRIIVDGLGYELIVRTSGYSDFANNPLPIGNGKIRGILTRYFDDYQLFIRTEKDIDMGSERTSINRLGIDALKSKSDGLITDNYYIEGIVTLSPKNGNITGRNIIMQDETGGIVVRFNNTVSSGVKEGNKLKILVKGSELGSFAGIAQLSEINFSGKIDGENIVETTDENAALPNPINVSISDLKSADYQSQLVNINDIQFTTDDVNKSLSGTREITDCENVFSVYTRSFSTFSENKTPEGLGSITGIASAYYDEKQLLLRNTNDFSNMTKSRCAEPEPIFYENFESISNTGYDIWVSLNDWYNISESGGVEKWEAREYSNNKYAQISAYNTDESTMVVWLVTSEIDMDNSTGEKLSFQTKDGYNNGEALEVFISTNFSGNNLSSASWTKIDASIASGSSSGYGSAFTESGSIDLSSYNGKIRIGFKYSGGDPSKTTTYQVDEIKVVGN